MKKYITAAAFLAAGTALANALTLVGTYTQHTTSGGADTWSLGSTAFSASDTTNYALVYELDVAALSTSLSGGSLSGKKIAGFDNSGSTNKFGVGVNSSGNLTFNNDAVGASITTTTWDVSPSVSISTDLLTRGDASLVAAAIVLSVGRGQNDGAAGLSLQYSDGTKVDAYGTNSSYKATNWSFTSVSAITGLVSSVSVFSGAPTDIANTTVLASTAQSVIPEPSAFGLLAGAGALALVAARRRRK